MLCSVVFELDKNEIILGPRLSTLLRGSHLCSDGGFSHYATVLKTEHTPIEMRGLNPETEGIVSFSASFVACALD